MATKRKPPVCYAILHHDGFRAYPTLDDVTVYAFHSSAERDEWVSRGSGISCNSGFRDSALASEPVVRAALRAGFSGALMTERTTTEVEEDGSISTYRVAVAF